ncbi:MAG: hypothetical protein MJK04_37105 [Psychrosphaera sp.]|nr:hypothetical protein [Psychrosphaera sp.]
MIFIWHKGLPYISVVLHIGGVEIAFSNVLIDSGAASSLFNIEKLFENGLGVDKNDIICEMIGADILRDMGAVIDFRHNTITSTLPV